MSKYFTYEGDAMLACPCCGTKGISEKFLEKLDVIREYVNIPLTITSGYRCAVHNRDVGGKDDSSHMSGIAVDIACDTSHLRALLVSKAFEIGFKRVGVSKRFIHLDLDTLKPQPRLWTY